MLVQASQDALRHLEIIMVGTKFPENIGMAARACANTGCGRLTLVSPAWWDKEKARPLATAKGEPLLDAIEVKPTLGDALAPNVLTFGTTARTGGWRRGLLTPEQAAGEIAPLLHEGSRVAIVFGCEDQLDFHHLMGLGKLKDLRIAKQNRGSVFDEIIIGSTTYETLAKSRYLPQIENRFEPLALIEQLLDDNRLVFRYNAKLNQFSLIEADYLLSTPLENSDIYIFIAEHKDTGKYFCRSFFPKEKKDYTEGQPRYTMLYKEKKNLTTGETVIQYDRLTPKTQT